MTRVAAVIIPTFNEAGAIGPLLAQLCRQPASVVAEILVADGRSTDATQPIVAAAANLDARIRLIDNPQRIQSAGLNLAAAKVLAPVDTLVRIDAHAGYRDDFVPRVLEAMTAAEVPMLAVRLITTGDTCTRRGIAMAQNSRFGTGGAAHRVGGTPGFVDHGHHAGIDRALFHRLGGYDTSFVANEDAEFDLRVRRSGGRIWLQTNLTVDYTPRPTLEALALQYWRYGRGRAMTFRKHGEQLRLRQWLPPAFVLAIAAALPLVVITPWALIVPALYLFAILIATLLLLRNNFSACTLIAAPAMIAMHLPWGSGFLFELAQRRTAGGPAAAGARGLQHEDGRCESFGRALRCSCW